MAEIRRPKGDSQAAVDFARQALAGAKDGPVLIGDSPRLRNQLVENRASPDSATKHLFENKSQKSSTNNDPLRATVIHCQSRLSPQPETKRTRLPTLRGSDNAQDKLPLRVSASSV